MMPAAFAFGHSLNHHRYNNGPLDVVSTADKPRDSLINFIAYLPRWTLYSLNISSIRQFVAEKNYAVAVKMVLGSLFWWTCFTLVLMHNATFAIAYMLYPLGENILLLAAINWCWHAFHDDQTQDEYVESITLLGGSMNILHEDYHLVHHQYPSAHWTTYPDKFKKHWSEYGEHQASMFKNTHAFEMFGLIVSRNYDSMADKFVDLKGEQEGHLLTMEQKRDLLKARLRACAWGPRCSRPDAYCDN